MTPNKYVIENKQEIQTDKVVSDKVLSLGKTYTNDRFHGEPYFPILTL
ncbi:hypothetical protein THZG08_120102 [Vibrio owensii]|nr:hypothetical protein THZG08_120102 [Vibrio owensii]CAH1550849.1 hypothetical protein THOA03_120102 [Vibrio owensii]